MKKYIYFLFIVILFVSATCNSKKSYYVIAGDFTSYNNINTNYLTLIDTLGNIDATFNKGGIGANKTISVISLYKDNKILVGGRLTKYNDYKSDRIFMLNLDGTIDNTFKAILPIDSNAFVHSIMPLNSGKILIGLQWDVFNGQNRLFKITQSGKVDTEFNKGNKGTNDDVLSILKDGNSYYIMGWFKKYNDVENNMICKIDENGKLDTTFKCKIKNGNFIHKALLNNNKLYVVGNIPNSVVCLNSTTGNIDTTFNLPINFNFPCYSIANSDNNIYLGYNGEIENNLFAIKYNGSIDTTFIEKKFNLDSGRLSIDNLLFDNNSLIAIGLFTGRDNEKRNRIVSIKESGNNNNIFDQECFNGRAFTMIKITK